MKALVAVLSLLAGLHLPAHAESFDPAFLHGLGDTRYERLESRHTDRGYHIYITLPDDYADGDSLYPAIYLLDGGALLPMLGAYHRYLVLGNEVPEAILVGISYGSADFRGGNFRSTDYTASSPEREYWGGAPAFQQFLAGELLPHVEKAYRADPARRIVFGHSIGGQFVLFTAQTRPALFSGHLASNPALHRNLPFFLRTRPAPGADRPTRLFVGGGSDDDPTFREPRAQWIRHWSADSSRLWQLEIRDFPGHSHMSTPPAVFREGLRWLEESRGDQVPRLPR